MSRRKFVTAAAGATAAASAAVAAPPGAKIRTAIIGIQHSHLSSKLKVLRENGDYEVVSVCEPNEATKAKSGSAAMFQNLTWVPSVDELLEDNTIDLVLFEGEVKDAVPVGKKVLAANKHLHLEKPPSNDYGPFAEMVEVARKRNRRLQLGYLWRFHPGTDFALDVFRKGWLGDVFMIRATINSDRDAAQRLVEARYAGGSMFELGGHMIDRIVAFWGRPDQVKSWLRHDNRIDDKLKDNTLSVFEYPKGIATVVSSSRDAAVHRTLELIGTEGSLMIDPMEGEVKVKLQLRKAQGPYAKGTQEVKFPAQTRWVADFEDLARAIKTGTALRYSYDHELTLQETLLRASGEIGG